MTQPTGHPGSMDWRQIQTALIGTNFSTSTHRFGGEGWDNLQQIDTGSGGDPGSLRNAAGRFAQLLQSVEELRQRLGAQRNQLVASGQWSGHGADSFDQAVRRLDLTMEDTARPLIGGHSYTQLLNRAATALESAQTRIVALNRLGAELTKAEYDRRAGEWATQTSQGMLPVPPAEPWFTTGNGTQVYTPSAYPEIDRQLTVQAQQIMQELTTVYRAVTGALNPPAGAVQPGASPTPPAPAASPGPGLPAPISAVPAPDPTGAAGAPAVGVPGPVSLPTSPPVSLPTSPAVPGVVGLPGAGPSGSGNLPGPGPSTPAPPSSPSLPSRPEFPGIPGLPGPPPVTATPGARPVTGMPGSPFPGGIVGGNAGGSGSPAIAPSFPFSGDGPAGGPVPGGTTSPVRILTGTTPPTGYGGPGPNLLSGAPLPWSGVAPNGVGPYGGMPMLPITPTGTNGNGRDERERITWLMEDRDIWSVTNPLASRVVTGGDADRDGTSHVLHPAEHANVDPVPSVQTERQHQVAH